jgi:STE24 endopeptidase
MTATRIVRGATLAAALGVWVFLAWLLWRTTVPAGLHAPRLDERAVFGPRLVAEARRFERFLDWEWAVATLAALGAYAVMVHRGRRLAPTLGLGNVNGGIVLGLLTLTVVWAVGVPFALGEAWWARRHGLSRESYGGVLASAYAQLLGTTLVAFVALAILLLLAHRLRRTWWLPAGLLLATILLVLQLVQPYQASIGTHPVRSARLAHSIRALEGRERAVGTAVRVEDVKGMTKEANAFSIGVGPTKRVILWNTLLDGRFSPGEVRFVVAHELGHVVRNHVLRGVAWFALLVLPVLLLTARLVDVRHPAGLPPALFVIAVVTLLLLPLRSVISRRYEREADWIALKTTRDPSAARGLFIEFVRTSLQDPSPPGWVHVLLDDHPTPLQRVEQAAAWARRNP